MAMKDSKSNVNNKRRDTEQKKREKKRAEIESTVPKKKKKPSCWNGGDENGSKNGKECRLWKLWYFFCFVLFSSYQPQPLETTSRQTQPFDQSRTLVVGSPTGVTTASKTQHQRLATLRPSARCNATRVVRPRRLHAAKQRLSRERSRRPRRRGEAMLFVYTTSIHPASVVVSTTQEMQRKIPLRHLSKVSM